LIFYKQGFSTGFFEGLESQKPILEKFSDGLLSFEIMQSIPLALISLWCERSSSNQYMYL